MSTTKDKILLIALRLFAEKGYYGVSVNMIVQELGLEQMCRFTLEQFKYWTEEEFPRLFRRLLTLERSGRKQKILFSRV